MEYERQKDHERNVTAKTIPTIVHSRRMMKTIPANIIQAVRNVRLGGDLFVGGFGKDLTGGCRGLCCFTDGTLLNQLSTD